MEGRVNTKIIGATLVGFALVAGAFVITNFGEPSQKFQVASTQTAVEPAPRVTIAVTDNDDNGIEDWRDTFVTSEVKIIKQATSTYTPPDTLTGQTSIRFMEGIINSKLHSPIAPNTEEVVTQTVDSLDRAVEIKLSDLKDIEVLEEWEDEDIVNYANTFAVVISSNDAGNTDYEIDILSDILRADKQERMDELVALRNIYQITHADALKIPVPKILVKEHLDLINTIGALAEDINGMTLAYSDPMKSLIHLKRYTEDAEGLAAAFTNMYDALDKHSELFTVDDPALFFAIFSPNYKP